jgi:hypothetical protein
MKCARILVFEDLAFGNAPNILYKDKNICILFYFSWNIYGPRPVLLCSDQ